MNRISLVLLFWLASLAATALTAEVKEIELNDGSVILTDEIISLNNGVYTIKTEAMGVLKIEASRVRAIRPQGSSAIVDSSRSKNEITNLQQQMVADQEMMDMLQSLGNDPEFKKILEDPEIMKAVNGNDAASLMNNPKFMRLLQNPSVKNIQRKLEK